MAAKDAVIVTTQNKPNGSRLVGISQNARQLVADISAVNLQLQHLFVATPADYTGVESQFGLAVGAGIELVTAIAAINTSLQDSNFQALCYQVQQA